MIFEVADKNIIVLLGLAVFWLGGMALISGGPITTIGYNMRKGFRYICSECGMLVPEHHYHGLTECKSHRTGKPKPDHRLWIGAKKYEKQPDWHSTLEEQRQ